MKYKVALRKTEEGFEENHVDRATLEPDGYIKLPSTLRHQQPVNVLVTFL